MLLLNVYCSFCVIIPQWKKAPTNLKQLSSSHLQSFTPHTIITIPGKQRPKVTKIWAISPLRPWRLWLEGAIGELLRTCRTTVVINRCQRGIYPALAKPSRVSVVVPLLLLRFDLYTTELAILVPKNRERRGMTPSSTSHPPSKKKCLLFPSNIFHQLYTFALSTKGSITSLFRQ